MIKLITPPSVTLSAVNKALSAHNLTATGSDGNFTVTVTDNFISGFVHRAISQYNVANNQSSSLHLIRENNFQLTFFKKSAASNLTVYNAASSDDSTGTPKYVVNYTITGTANNQDETQDNATIKHRTTHTAVEENDKIKRYHLIKGDYIQHKEYYGEKSKNKYFTGDSAQTYKLNKSNEADDKTTVQLTSIVAKEIIKNAHIDTKETNYGSSDKKVPLIANITQVGTQLGTISGFNVDSPGWSSVTMGGLGFATFGADRNTDTTIDIQKEAKHYDATLTIPEKNTVVNTTKKTSLMEFITEYMTLGLAIGTMGGMETVLRKSKNYRKLLDAKNLSKKGLGKVFLALAKIGFSYFMSTILTNYIKNEIFGAKNTDHLQDKMLPASSDLKQVSFYQHFAQDVKMVRTQGEKAGETTSFTTAVDQPLNHTNSGTSIFANTGWFYSRSVVHSHILNAAVHYSENYFGSMYTKAISGVQFSFYVTDTIKTSSLAALMAKMDNRTGYAATQMLVATHYYGKCACFTRKTGMTIEF